MKTSLLLNRVYVNKLQEDVLHDVIALGIIKLPDSVMDVMGEVAIRCWQLLQCQMKQRGPLEGDSEFVIITAYQHLRLNATIGLLLITNGICPIS